MTQETGPRPVPPIEHVEPLDLIAYSRGELTRGRAAEVRSHCADCVSCGDQLAALIAVATADAHEFEQPRPEAVVMQGQFKRGWPRRGIAAGIALMALAAFWQFGSTREPIVELTPIPSEVGQPLVVPSELDETLIGDEVTVFEMAVGSDARVSGGDLSDHEALKAGLRAVQSRDLAAATNQLSRFGEDGTWSRYGTALLGYAQFLNSDPDAFLTLNFLLSGLQMPPIEEDANADLVLYFLARMHHERGEEVRARELVSWTHSRQGVGQVARAWRDATYGVR